MSEASRPSTPVGTGLTSAQCDVHAYLLADTSHRWQA